jgi:hypothetical protein
MLLRVSLVVVGSMIAMSAMPVQAQQRAVGSRAPAMPVTVPNSSSGMGAVPGTASGAAAPSMGANPRALNPGTVAADGGNSMGMSTPTTNPVK